MANDDNNEAGEERLETMKTVDTNQANTSTEPKRFISQHFK